MKQIVVEISPEGEIKIEAVGYKGQGCTKATEALEKAMGISSKKTIKKPEFYEQAVAGQKVGG